MADQNSKPFVLVILDGWGVGPVDESNAIRLAKTPNMDTYREKFGSTELKASSVHVGLQRGQDGNSEAGHMNIGAGRVVEQDSIMISRAISDGTFFKNPAFMQAVKHAKKHQSNIHVMGMLSNGQSAHAHPDHLIALITFLRFQKIGEIFLHLFSDGRDSPRFDAIKLMRKFHPFLSSRSAVATICGRAYAMDRKKDWSRTKAAYEALVLGKGIYEASSAEDAILNAYNRGETDEFIQPTVITGNGKPIARIRDRDSIIFFNLRSDRARQLTKTFTQADFENLNKGSFKRNKVLKKIFFVAMTDFGPDLDLLTAYPSRDLVDTLPMVLKDMPQLYIAESEKYAHMTYFFNGGYDQPVAGEDRLLVPSPDMLSYKKTPHMALQEITDRVLGALKKNNYGFIGVNVSNADMIAHTGSIKATVQAIEFVDKCLGRIVPDVLARGGMLCITADHGNAEELMNRKTGEIDTEHSASPVPCIFITRGAKLKLRKGGILADVAPTILQLMKVRQPEAMTGKSLIE